MSIDGVMRVIDHKPETDEDGAPYQLFNIGNDQPVGLLEFIQTLGSCLDVKAELEMLPMQDGDMVATHANINAIRALGYAPVTSLQDGLQRFVAWYRDYHG